MAKEITHDRLQPEALLKGYQEADQPVDRFPVLREEPGRPAPPVRLEGLRQLIFLDRYAQKDPQRRFRPGELAVVQVKDDPRAPEKEVGRIVTSGRERATVQLVQTGEVIERPLKLVERPLETHPAQMWDRMARAAAAVEKEDQRAGWERAFRWSLDGFRFVPGGRISTMLGTGQNLTAYNCYVIPVQPDGGPGHNDSRRSIIDTLGRMVEIMSRGGGVGINLSTLRPQLAPVRGVNGRSSGSVSWGGLFSFATGLVEQGGSRRGALMLMIDDWHPDLLRFIRAKQAMGAITNANMSVCVSDAFMQAVQEDGEWELVFPDTADPEYDRLWDGDLRAWRERGKAVEVYDRIRARDVWNEIVTSAWKSAEPGVVFIDRYNQYSNARYYARIACTNPCGEQGLPPFGVCNLGHINLARFVEGLPGQPRVLWDELARAVWLGVRFLDNVIDITPYFLPENEALQKSERRVGLGTMGLGEMLIRLGIRYGSDESLAFMDRLYGFITRHAYRASVAIAREKGSFPRFEAEGFLSSAFMQAMPQEIQEAVRTHGIRNVTLITQAPTGTTGTMVGTSTGIEPYYSWTYFRKGRLGRKRVVEPIVAEVLGISPEDAERLAEAEGPLPDAFVTALELTPEEHVRVQAVAQRWCDSSISKTANLPAQYTVEQTEAIYRLAYDLGCKGVTIYRDRSRDEQVLSRA